jgi:hypothetical protein
MSEGKKERSFHGYLDELLSFAEDNSGLKEQQAAAMLEWLVSFIEGAKISLLVLLILIIGTFDS